MTKTRVHEMKVGTSGPMGPPGKALTARPAAAEQAGYASLWWGDHYMGWVPRSIWTPDIGGVARPGTNPDVFFDPIAAMAVAGTVTSNLSIGVTTESIRRHPVALAQQFLTLQHISGGRAILGLGGGEGENILPYGLDVREADRPLGGGPPAHPHSVGHGRTGEVRGRALPARGRGAGRCPAGGRATPGVDLRCGSADVPDRRSARRRLASGHAPARRVRREAPADQHRAGRRGP